MWFATDIKLERTFSCMWELVCSMCVEVHLVMEKMGAKGLRRCGG
jgi:hypothetical protein